ncbi:MAG: tRNA 5-methoxyuridine(34)/uridine 5-oxyacetic acid(34) synthase CmoB [Spirochaetia bacterium]|nr:tRNA 5-methoxyuridine(34)/uridine 5-oxyacetic acid(34) synthase CmoB [Spirochaetia bacterium]
MLENQLKYLYPYEDKIDLSSLKKIISKTKLTNEKNKIFIDALESVKKIKTGYKDYSSAIVKIGHYQEINDKEKEILKKSLSAFIPYRKGPFSIFGIDIDAEWRSDLKWDRFLPFIDDMQDKKICDIGANSGYYMFRMAHHGPQLVLGIDPTLRFKYTFELFQNFAKEPNLYYELFGFQHLKYFKSFFDIIFCMGIIYHHKNPLEVLNNVFAALKPGGQILVESMGVEGNTSTAFFPEKKYAGVSGVWFVPDEKCLYNWLKRTGYSDIECHHNILLSETEQRKTNWSPYKSYSDFINIKNRNETIEGYQLPRRIYFTARKK